MQRDVKRQTQTEICDNVRTQVEMEPVQRREVSLIDATQKVTQCWQRRRCFWGHQLKSYWS